MTKSSWSDTVKFSFVVILIISGVVLNAMFVSQPITLRLIAWILLACVVLFIASQTTQGKAAILFIKQSQTELRKVVWPTRQETVQTTMIVVAMVVFVSLALWVVDLGFLWAIGLLTGSR